MAMKGCSTFPKAPALLQPHHQIIEYHIQDTRLGGESYLSAEMQSVYSTAQANWVTGHLLGWGGGLIPLQRCTRCILQPLPTGQEGGGMLYTGEGQVSTTLVFKNMSFLFISFTTKYQNHWMRERERERERERVGQELLWFTLSWDRYISSSSSCRVGSTDIPDPLSPLLPIVHRPRQVFRTTSCILT